MKAKRACRNAKFRKGLSLGAITVRGEKGDGEVYFYAQYPKVKAKDICNIIERES